MLVGFCGPMGAGKTTAAKYLVDEHGFERIPFAKILKDMARTFGLTEAQVNGEEKETPITHYQGEPVNWTWSPRWFMQHLGTRFGREMLGENIWIDIWKLRAKAFKRVVVDDVRFPNEVTAVQDLGGKTILIDRGIKWSGDHASEQWHRLQWDIGIVNGGSCEDLYRSLERMLWPAEAAPA